VARRLLPIVASLLLVVVALPLHAQARGHLYIVGGGPRPDAMVAHFVELAGGANAKILVLPNASANPGDAAEGVANLYRRHGAGEVRTLILDREKADAPDVAAQFEGITAIWFPGGVQSRITRDLRGTAAHRAILAAYARGVTIGGTSAGAAIMTSPMITGGEKRPGGDRPPSDPADADFIVIEPDNIETEEGLDLLPGAVVDQHFVRRKRHNRLISLAMEHNDKVAAGIDESTAIVVRPDLTWQIVGESVVIVYDARPATVNRVGDAFGAAGMRMHVLPAGSIYDPGTGQATLPR